MTPRAEVAVVGRFPPPLDGQTLATARLAELVGEARPVVTVSTSAPEGDQLVSTEARWSWRRAAHYLGTGRRLRRELAAAPDAPVLWASISPHPLGHARDVLTTLPAFGPTRPVVAVVHRAYFDRMFAGVTAATARRVVGRCAAVVFLTEGLAEIPATPPEVRAEADARRLDQGHDALLPEIDPETRARLDTRNPMRVQRAWEVQRATGRGLASWQDATPEPLLPLAQAQALRVDVERDWLNARIARRFDLMLAQGALDEARANLARWDPALLSFKAIGAPELIAHLHGEIPLEDAREKATIATCQFAKRQRTWLRSRMKAWQGVEAAALC